MIKLFKYFLYKQGKYVLTTRMMDETFCNNFNDLYAENNENSNAFFEVQECSEYLLKHKKNIYGKWTKENSFGPERLKISHFQK